MKKKLVAFLVSSSLVLSAAFSSYAAAYDFIRKSDNKIFSILDVATDPDVLLDIATDDTGFMVELKDGKKYDLAAYKAIVTANPGISEDDVIAKLNKETELKVVSVSAINDTKLNIKLSKAVDAAESKNFAIEGVTVVSATLSENKQEVALQVQNAEVGKEYTLTITGLKANGENQPEINHKFKMPDAAASYQTALDFGGKKVLKSDGSDSALVTFKLTDAEGKPVTGAGDVEVAFTTTFGGFAENRVTLQNGVATAMLISEALNVEREALVRATIVEAADKRFINMSAEGKIKMSPNPEEGQEDTVGATLTDVLAEQADRVILYFNKEVDVKNYVDENGAPDSNEAQINVRTKALNDMTGGTNIDPIAYKAVLGNKKALVAILPTANVLTDNANVAVDFKDKTGNIATNSTKMTKLTDARKPAMLNVAPEGLKKLIVTFSEPVVSGAGDTYSAEKLENWIIDGKVLSDKAWGKLPPPGAFTKIKVGEFDPKTGEDKRHIVTIELGKDAAGNQIYFKPGKHSLQGAKIGDWANKTDDPNNVMNTQTLDFEIPEDNDVPSAEVKVQSPEQYLLKFNKELAADLTAADIKLQKYNTATSLWADVPVGSGKDKQDLKVTKVGDVDYKIEVKQDWTQAYDTKNSNKNYYNNDYRLFIAKDTVAAASNGKKNPELALLLEGAMKTPDTVSPSIAEIEKVENEAYYSVKMSEPVKMPAGGDTLPTLAQTQASVPQPTAQFIKADNSVTIDAKTINTVLDKEDYLLEIEPQASLSAGSWKLVVKSISDDVGNTSASVEKMFTVEGTVAVESDFEILWAVADTNYSDGFTNLQSDKTAGANELDAIYIKFNKPVKITEDYANALKTANYTLNGAALPLGTQIVANIKNYDDKGSYDADSVTIVLPGDFLTDANTTVITVSEFIQSLKGEKLSNGGQKKLPFQYPDDVGSIATVNTKAALEAALKDKKVRKITLSAAINLGGTLTIDRAVDIDLAANNITGNLIYNFAEGASVVISSTGGAASVVGDLTTDVPNTTFTVGAGVTVTGTTTIKDVTTGTFINKGTLDKVVVTDATGSIVKNESTINGRIHIATAANVELAGAGLSEIVIENAHANVSAPAGTSVTVDPSVTDKSNLKVTVGGTVQDNSALSATKSWDTGVKEIRVCGEVAQVDPSDDRIYHVALPQGKALNAVVVGDVLVILNHSAAQLQANPATSDGGKTWTFTVQAEETTKTKDYQIKVVLNAAEQEKIETAKAKVAEYEALLVDEPEKIAQALDELLGTKKGATAAVQAIQAIDAAEHGILDGKITAKDALIAAAAKIDSVEIVAPGELKIGKAQNAERPLEVVAKNAEGVKLESPLQGDYVITYTWTVESAADAGSPTTVTNETNFLEITPDAQDTSTAILKIKSVSGVDAGDSWEIKIKANQTAVPSGKEITKTVTAE